MQEKKKKAFELEFIKPYASFVNGKPKAIPMVVQGLLPQGGFAVLGAPPLCLGAPFNSHVYIRKVCMSFRTQVDVPWIISQVSGARQALGTGASVRAVARHLKAVDDIGKALPSVAVACDLLALVEARAVTQAVLEKLTRGLTVTALQQLARTLKAEHREHLVAQAEIEAEQFK